MNVKSNKRLASQSSGTDLTLSGTIKANKIYIGGKDVTSTVTAIPTSSQGSTVSAAVAADTLKTGATGSDLTLSGNLTMSSTTANATISNLTTVGNITLPTTITSPISGQLGYVTTGAFNPDSKLVSRLSPCSGYLSKISLPAGVWLIHATGGIYCNTYGNNLNNFSIQISSTANTGADLVAGTAIPLVTTAPYSVINYNSINSGGWNSVDTASVLIVTTTTMFYLNYYANFTGGATAYTVISGTANPFAFRAVRIA